MNEADTRELALALVHADTEDEVADLLDRAGYWSDLRYWRCLGDNENNYSVIGSQQSRSDAKSRRLIKCNLGVVAMACSI